MKEFWDWFERDPVMTIYFNSGSAAPLAPLDVLLLFLLLGFPILLWLTRG